MSTRAEVIADTGLKGLAACHALSDATDEWLRGVFATAVDGEKKADRIALIEIGRAHV